MLWYIIRRILYMIPTVFGVILLTFVLFNIAGGDPAVMKLGQQARPKSLEDYDLQRGYNKPLFFGHWGTARAYRGDFKKNAGPWMGVKGAVYTNSPGRIILSNTNEINVPLAFRLRPDDEYRWTIEYRQKRETARGPAAFLVMDGSNVLQTVSLGDFGGWTKATVNVKTGPDTSGLKFIVTLQEGDSIEIRLMELGRRVRNPLDSQFVFYLSQIVRFDFGVSAESNQRVSSMILDGILPSLALTVPMFIVGLLVEISLALVCAFFRNRFIDRFFVVFSVILMSVNYLVWIVFGQYFLGYMMRWFPVWGFESWSYLVLPCIIGTVSGLGSGIRFYRTIMLDEMYRDYVRTAFAKGVSKSGVLFKHVLKNAMIPILTSVVMTIPFLYTGSLLLESFFGIPGIGNLSINGINNSDVDVIRAVVFVGAMIYVVANLITDICYTLVDPRVKLR